MSANRRDHILARIRTALGKSRTAPAARAALNRRMAMPPVAPPPAMGDDLIGRFIAKAEGNGLTVEPIASLRMLVPAMDRLLRETGTRSDIGIAPALADLGWPEDWHVNIGAGRREERLSVTLATAGIAETGSVVFRSGPESPASLNFLPDIHVVVLHASDILPHPEDLWARFRSDGRDWPRAINVIAGPSRTADVGGIIVRPAHGPKAVHLFLLGSD
ncbi:MAG: LutC/YkgG family protein [Methyloligella sp. ZOD6]